MKNIIDICKDFGFEIPAEKHADFLKAVNSEYKTILEHQKVADKLTAAEQRAETAEGVLKSFEGIDPEKMQQEIQTYKQNAEDAKKEYAKQLLHRDQRDWLKGKLDEYGVASPYARKQLIADCMDESSGLKWKDGAFFGFDDFMKKAKEQDAALYQTAEEKAAAEKAAEEAAKAPQFTAPGGDSKPGSKKFVPPTIF